MNEIEYYHFQLFHELFFPETGLLGVNAVTLFSKVETQRAHKREKFCTPQECRAHLKPQVNELSPVRGVSLEAVDVLHVVHQLCFLFLDRREAGLQAALVDHQLRRLGGCGLVALTLRAHGEKALATDLRSDLVVQSRPLWDTGVRGVRSTY